MFPYKDNIIEELKDDLLNICIQLQLMTFLGKMKCCEAVEVNVYVHTDGRINCIGFHLEDILLFTTTINCFLTRYNNRRTKH